MRTFLPSQEKQEYISKHVGLTITSLLLRYIRVLLARYDLLSLSLSPPLPINIEKMKKKNTNYSPTRLIFREVKGRAY